MSLVSIPMLDTIEAYYMNVLLVTMHSKTFQILQFSFLHSRYSNTIHNSLKIIEKRHILLKRNSELLPKMQQSCIAVGALSNRLKTLWWQYMCVAFIQCTLFCESKRLCTLHMVIKEIQRSLDVVKLSFALHKSEFRRDDIECSPKYRSSSIYMLDILFFEYSYLRRHQQRRMNSCVPCIAHSIQQIYSNSKQIRLLSGVPASTAAQSML